MPYIEERAEDLIRRVNKHIAECEDLAKEEKQLEADSAKISPAILAAKTKEHSARTLKLNAQAHALKQDCDSLTNLVRNVAQPQTHTRHHGARSFWKIW